MNVYEQRKLRYNLKTATEAASRNNKEREMWGKVGLVQPCFYMDVFFFILICNDANRKKEITAVVMVCYILEITFEY